jgi:chromosome segregation ATPase
LSKDGEGDKGGEVLSRVNNMTLERRDIEEVGEAVEALGIMVEEELTAINQRLGELHTFISLMKEEEQSFKVELLGLKNEMMKTQEVVKGLENIVSRTESRLIDLQKGISDEEDFSEDIKNDLLIIKRDLQFVRSDLKELLEQRKNSEE